MAVHVRRAPLRLTFLAALAATGLALLSACAGGGAEFPADLPDDAYPLEAMLLSIDELPVPMDAEEEGVFDNGDWAQFFDVEDLRAKVNQREARGRIEGAIREFSWSGSFPLGGPAVIILQSTLYTDADAARDSLSLFCGTLTDERGATDVTDFWVAGMGDGVQGYVLRQQVEGLPRLVETVVCFRTGRVVHAVVQNGFDGSEDVALTVRIARRMYENVRAVFADLEAEASGS